MDLVLWGGGGTGLSGAGADYTLPLPGGQEDFKIKPAVKDLLILAHIFYSLCDPRYSILNIQSQMIQTGQFFRKSLPARFVNIRSMKRSGIHTPQN